MARIIILAVLLGGCLSAPRFPGIDTPTPSIPSGSEGGIAWLGEWCIVAGVFGIIAGLVCAIVLGIRPLGGHIATVGGVVVAVGCGIIYIAPWMPWIIGGAVVFGVLFVAYFVWRNWRDIDRAVADAIPDKDKE